MRNVTQKQYQELLTAPWQALIDIRIIRIAYAGTFIRR